MEINASTLELLTWVTARPRTYEDVVEAWKSNCPRFAVWDDAVTAGLVTAGRDGVALTALRPAQALEQDLLQRVAAEA